MRRVGKAVCALAAVAAMSWPTAVWADDCGNFSRSTTNATPWETERGRWFLIETEIGTFWVFDKPGGDEALLDNARCPTARLIGHLQGTPPKDGDLVSGVWSESCFERAVG